jgi:two-component system, cell cycle response regulator
MTRILTVDDSRAVRSFVIKALANTGYEIIQAEDGVEGLAKLAEGPVDLILLDVTMPNMDGPTMLAEIRSKGDQTPVIALTAEASTAVIGTMMQAGISDYVLKPFKPDGLTSKVEKALKAAGASSAGGGTAMVAEAEPEPSRIPAAGKPFIDVMVVDDMVNVSKKVRELLPDHLKVKSATDGQTAVQMCKEAIFRTVMLDTDIPDVNTVALLSQLRALQPTAAFLALFMRNIENKAQLARDQGFDAYLEKPFDPVKIDDFLEEYFQTHEMLIVDDNVLQVSDFAGNTERLEKNYLRLAKLIEDAVGKAAAACHEIVVLDLTKSPDSPKLVNVIVKTNARCSDMGLVLRIATAPELADFYKGYKETKDLPFFKTAEEALSNQAA